jgi:hypothetical protein
MDVFSPASLTGAAIGLAMGAIQYAIARVVIDRIIAAARSEEGPADDEDEFERRLGLVRKRLLVGSIVVLPVSGFVLGHLVGTHQ